MIPADKAVEHRLRTLELEYSTLRAEILSMTGARFQFLTIPPVILALGVTIVGASSRKAPWVAPTFLGILIFLVALGTTVFLWIGRIIGGISAHLVTLEEAINQVLEQHCGAGPGLSWERTRQHRVGLDRFLNGPGRSAPVPGPPR